VTSRLIPKKSRLKALHSYDLGSRRHWSFWVPSPSAPSRQALSQVRASGATCFLTAGRGLHNTLAGVAVSAYWAMMFLGRAVLGPVAEHVGAAGCLLARWRAWPSGLRS